MPIETIYRCTCCGKLFNGTTMALDHESECLYNPYNKSCVTCARIYNHPNLDADYEDIRVCTKHGKLKDMTCIPIRCDDWRDK